MMLCMTIIRSHKTDVLFKDLRIRCDIERVYSRNAHAAIIVDKDEECNGRC